MSIEFPYCFSEVMEPRQAPSERERLLKITQADREWLRAVLLPDHQARQALEKPMLVEKLSFTMRNSKVVDLAGSFLMTARARDSAFLYTPGFGIEHFDSRSQAVDRLTERLNDPELRDELLRFVALRVKASLDFTHSATVLTEVIRGRVFPDRRRSIDASLEDNQDCLQTELLKLPTLRSLLIRALAVEAGQCFAQVSLESVTVISYASGVDDECRLKRCQLSICSLTDVLLKHYKESAWPQNQTREFIAPGYSPGTGDTHHWEAIIEKVSTRLIHHFRRELSNFWNAPLDNGRSRRNFFAEAMGTTFRSELLKQQLSENLSPHDHYWLSGLYPHAPSRLKQISVRSVSGKTQKASYIEVTHAFQGSNRAVAPDKFFLYISERLKVFDSSESLDESVRRQWVNPHQEILSALPLQARADLMQFHVVPEGERAVSLPLFQNIIETILSSQLSNIRYIIERYRQRGGDLNLDAAFDIALDIRAMFDRRLLLSDARGRWSTRLDLLNTEYSHSAPLQAAPATTLEEAKQRLLALETLKTEVLNGLANRPQLMTYAEKVLSGELVAAHRSDLTPTNIYINRDTGTHAQQGSHQALSSTTLIEHLLERSVGRVGPLSNTIGLGLFSQSPEGSWLPINNLDIATTNEIVTLALKHFLPNFLRQHRSVYASIRERLIEAVSQGLRNEVSQRMVDSSLKQNARKLLDIVLDSPDIQRRRSLNGFIPDAFRLTLKRSQLSLPELLFNCFLITERGGLDPHNSGNALLWTPEYGLEIFDSPYSVEIELNRRLIDPVERLPLLTNSARIRRASEAQPDNHQSEPRIGFELIEQGFLSSCFQSLTDKALDEIAYTASMGLSANNLHNRVQSCLAEHANVEHLDKSIDATRNNALRLSLPAWLATAEHDGQLALAALLDQYRQQADAAKDIHYDIPDLHSFTRAKLSALLHRDFPGEGLDPDQLTVSTLLPDTKAVSSLSLVTYALQHVDNLKVHANVARANGSDPLPDALTGGYLKSLIKETAIGSQYASLLDSFLSPRGGSRERQTVFSTHLLWQCLERGLTQVLQKRLSNSAYHLIKQVLGMPDGLARTALDGLSIIFRPLELVTAGRVAPDLARGLYLIGSSLIEQGPQVLLSTHGEGAVFREYSNEAALLRALSHTGELQKEVLNKLPQAARHYYANTVFTSSQPAVRITNNAIQGNLFARLYNDHLLWLKKKLNFQHMTGERHAWDWVVSLLKTGLYQGAQFMLGRLRLPLVIWQTFSQLKDAYDNAWKGHWKTAMGEFVSVLAQLALAQKGQASALSSATIADTSSAEAETAIHAPYPRLGWAHPILTKEQIARLHSYEVTDVALKDLSHEASLNIYTHAASNRQYAAVGGSIFQVGKENERWRILTEVEQGPWIKKDTQGQWALDLPGRLLGGGLVTQWRDRLENQRTLRQELEVQAVGMPAIKRLFPDKARRIGQAHELAVTYLKNAEVRLQSLTNDSRLDRQRHAYVKDFFGVSSLSRALRQEIEAMINTLLQTALDPARAPATSDLYVIGAGKKLDEPCVAFVLTCEAKKRIYLSEKFFEPNLQAYQPIRPRTFNMLLHSMASTLLHEFSHIALDALDISYLNAFYPFHDLIDTSTPDGEERQRWVREIQEESLSHRTPVLKLFRTEDTLSGGWTDVEGKAFERVLTLTGAKELYQARSHFLSDPVKRANVILANADSVALLISHLGRPIESYPLFAGFVP
ncbi:hypothetical protein HX776_16445 [Pseudomonas agarici]|uniref:dermonecrotic toxin domain-containing protein n=1 Tax=Pseudomonas agarici TaxID=46677 RepID=UPI0002FA865B|nr:DUF6543 domain-containing protein [Pseudomonas agarici]NWC10400.1 hypothetical protein [Pseudomonas agarici]SEK23065.1 hypothetical protein SAMN05216604_101259 [Pseudomonas agarici]